MDEYRVVGPDGKEYGPVDLPGLQQWIREGRLLKDTRVRKNNGTPISADLLAELAPSFAPPPEQPRVPPIATTVTVMSEFRTWGFIGQAWELVKPHWLVLSAMHLVSFLIGGVLGMIPILGPFIGMAVQAVLMVGIIRATLGVLAGRTPDLEMMFSGFDRAWPAIIAVFVMNLFILIGIALLIVPGIIVALMVMFTNYVIAETELDFWTAMTTSADLTSGYKWNLFVFCLALLPIMLLGLLACCVGIVVSMALAVMSTALVYRFLQAKKAQPIATIATVAP